MSLRRKSTKWTFLYMNMTEIWNLFFWAFIPQSKQTYWCVKPQRRIGYKLDWTEQFLEKWLREKHMDRRLVLSVGMFTSATELLMDACGDESTTHNLDSPVVEDIWKAAGKSIGNAFNL